MTKKLPAYWYSIANSVLESTEWENEATPGDRIGTITVYTGELHLLLLAAKWAYNNGFVEDTLKDKEDKND